MKWNMLLFALVFLTSLSWGARPERQLAGAAQESQLVRDLRAVRKGDKVALTWSQPRDTRNRQSVSRHLAVAKICRNISLTILDSGLGCPNTIGQVNLKESESIAVIHVSGKRNAETTIRMIDLLPKGQNDSDQLLFAVYKVEFRDDQGRRVGFSNSVAIPLAPVLTAEGLHSELDAHGVYLIWEEETENRSSLLKFDYRIYRCEKGSSKRVAIPYLRAVVHTPEGERWSGVDTNAEWEKDYLYSVTPITRLYSPDRRLIAEIEGDESAPLEIITHDVFPPAPPEKLLPLVGHVLGKEFVDLLWTPNTEKDIFGYNVYRWEENGQPARINSVPITMLSFQDVNVLAAHKYFYCISALDLRGNESAMSQPTAAVVP